MTTYTFDKYKISSEALNDLYHELCKIFNHEVVVQNSDHNVLNAIPYSGDYAKWIYERFLEEQNFILTNRFTSGKMKVSYKEFVDYIKANKLADKNGEVKEGLVGLWK